MNDDAIVFAMANPTPEVMPEDAAPYVRIMATGRSDYPNQINNVLAFPGIFRGALDAGAPSITEEMKLAAAKGIAMAVSEDDLAEDYIIPSVFNREVAPKVAEAVVEEAKRDGIARLNEETGTFATVEATVRAGTGAVKVLVTGASGLIGSALCDALLARGDDVVGLTPRPRAGAPRPTPASTGTPGSRPWNGRRPRPSTGVDGVVNLLGEKIDQRWTDEAKRRIMESRRTGTHNLVGSDRRPRAARRGCWSASRRSATTATAATPSSTSRPGPGRASTPRSCGSGRRRPARSRASACAWRSSAPARSSTPSGGMLAELLPPFKLGVGGPLAGGDQYLSWIHIDDEVGMLLWALDNDEVSGVVNATAPNPATQPGLLEGARPGAGPPGGDAGPRLRPRPQIRRRVRRRCCAAASG